MSNDEIYEIARKRMKDHPREFNGKIINVLAMATNFHGFDGSVTLGDVSTEEQLLIMRLVSDQQKRERATEPLKFGSKGDHKDVV